MGVHDHYLAVMKVPCHDLKQIFALVIAIK
jgi:hypothetical protein